MTICDLFFACICAVGFSVFHRKMPTRTHLDTSQIESNKKKTKTTIHTFSTLNHSPHTQAHYRVVCSINSEIFMMIIILCTNAFENNRQFMWISTAMVMCIFDGTHPHRTRVFTNTCTSLLFDSIINIIIVVVVVVVVVVPWYVICILYRNLLHMSERKKQTCKTKENT